LRFKLLPLALFAVLSLTSVAIAQNSAAALANLPEADAVIYISPQRILNEAAPRVMSPADVTSMRNEFAEMKKSVGVDPATIEYLVIAVRFNKPSTNLSFIAPDVMIVAGGDFSSESLMSLGQLYLQDKARVEKHGSKSITVMNLESLVPDVVKNPMLKPYSEIGIVPLSANSVAIGNLSYLKSAVDAAEGNGRISAATIESLLRDPNALLSTAKIINNLLTMLMQQGIGAVPDKQAQSILQSVKMSARENEVVWEADVPEKTVADFIQMTTKSAVPASAPAPKPVKTRSPVVPRKRTRKN